jgi:translation elongation factor EF-1beta
MAEQLRYAYLASGTQLKIPAKTGYNHTILEIYIDSPATNSYMDVYVGSKIVARFPVKWGDSLFVAPNSASINNKSLLGWIRDFFGEDYKIEGDSSEDISFNFSATQTGVHVFYLEHTNNIDKSRPLRSLSPTKVLFHILTHSAAINATKNYSLDTAIIPTGFMEIKDGWICPSGKRFTLKALAFGSAQAGSTTPTFLHIWKENLEYITPDHGGVSVRYGQNTLAFDITRNDFFDIPDITFEAGQKLTINFDASFDGTNAIPANTLAAILIGLEEATR